MNVLVIVPTYNERENLPILLPQLLEPRGYRVLVVDDGSPDGTGEVADALARRYPGRVEVLHRTGPRGLGRSYVDALIRAREGNADFVCHMDADLSHDPQYLPALVDRAAAGDDLVIGSRYLRARSVVNWPLWRRLLSAVGNRYVRAITRLPVRDCTSGYRCWRRAALSRLPLDAIRSNGYAFLVETVYEATRCGCRVSEVPIVFVERRAGPSKMSGRVILESVWMPWRLVFGGPDRGRRPTARETVHRKTPERN